MPLNHSGISVWVTDSEENELPMYGIQVVNKNTIECWIPSTEGSNFKFLWKIPSHSPHPRLDLAIYPYLDGVSMQGTVWRRNDIFPGGIGALDSHRTGPSTILSNYSTFFALSDILDEEDGAKPTDAQLKYLNTILAEFDWGNNVEYLPNSEYKIPQESAPLNEKLIKKGHSGSAGLGKTVTRAQLPDQRCKFRSSTSVQPTKFIFRYAPRDWLKARDIIPHSPQPSPSPQLKPKREWSFDSDVIDIDNLHTDEEDVTIVKHLVPASFAPRKKKRTVKSEETSVKTQLEDE